MQRVRSMQKILLVGLFTGVGQEVNSAGLMDRPVFPPPYAVTRPIKHSRLPLKAKLRMPHPIVLDLADLVFTQQGCVLEPKLVGKTGEAKCLVG